MAKSKIIAIAVSVGLLLVAAVVTGVLWATNRLPDVDDIIGGNTFNVGIGSDVYEKNTTGFVLDNGATITVTTPADDYDVTVYTKPAVTDFTFTVGGDTWKWSDTVGTDFTSGFNIAKDGKKFAVTYINLATVIAKVLRYDYGDVQIPDAPACDLFEMWITSGENTILLGFTLSDLGGNVGISGIGIKPDHIVFGGADV